MARILAIDYGAKRCGLAETDDLQIIASALEVVSAVGLMAWLEAYLRKHEVEGLVVGQPVRMSGEMSAVETEIEAFIKRFRKAHPGVEVFRVSEQYTSKMAMQTMIQAGAGRKARRDKGTIDKISATLILQQFLEIKRNKQSI